MDDDRRDQLAADLAWAINSNSLITCDASDPFSIDPDVIDRADLGKFIQDRLCYRVGRYFESLVLYWLTRIRSVKLIAHQHQVIRSGKTVGEIDFLFEDEEGEFVHLETAVKFFLQPKPTHPQCDLWVGPNAKDRLDLKLERLFNHQLRLCEKRFPQPTKRAALVKGRLFVPFGHTTKAKRPAMTSSQHLGGRWLHKSELSLLDGDEESPRFELLAKPFWLTAAGHRPLTFKQLIDAMSPARPGSIRSASMVAVLDSAGRESERLIVVDDNWPLKPGP